MDPVTTISAAVIGTEFLKEGIKFLWKQADDIIKRHIAKNDEKKKAADTTLKPVKVPAFLETPPALMVDDAEVEKRVADLTVIKNSIEPYLDKDLSPAEAETVKKYLDTLQSLVEAIYHYKFRVNPEILQNIIHAGNDSHIEADEVKQDIGNGRTAQNKVAAQDRSSVKIKKIDQVIK